MKHLGLFEGIGGFILAARWMGWHTVAWCEWDAFCQKVLRYHFPEAEGYGDITKTDFTKYAGKIDILTGGFPCQPYSTAGKRMGTADSRHLWPEMLRAIREVQPRWVVGENVRGLVSWNEGLVFHQVQVDLEAEGYEVFPVLLPACAVDAPHRRDRIWFVAYRDSNGFYKRNGEDEIEPGKGGEYALRDLESGFNDGFASDSENQRLQQAVPSRDGRDGSSHGNSSRVAADTNGEQRCKGRVHKTERKKAERHTCTRNARNGWGYWKNFPTQSPVCGGDDGLPRELDGITFSKWRQESIKGYGNAVVPQVVIQLFKVIQTIETQ